jgi:hypothetical protein
MGLYGFQKRFVPFILSGEKTHTIRAIRANPDKPGNTLHLYTGLRQKGARLLMRVPCVKVEGIVITPGGMIRIADQWLEDDEREALARRDGFEDFASMIRFWREPKNRLPFHGHIIHWRRCGRETIPARA